MRDILDRLLGMMLNKQASDMHIRAQEPVYFRIQGDLVPVPGTGYLNEDIRGFIEASLGFVNPQKLEEFLTTGDADYSYSPNNSEHRFRFNAYRERGNYSLAIRHIHSSPPNYLSLGLPQDVPEVIGTLNGLILAVGPAGSGKTTTIASMVNWLNENRRLHIITVEDPIEYHHTSKMSLISQREVGADTQSFSVALRQALRQDPDVIVIGEIRDYETMKLATTAAETGHLVLATLHSINSVQAINRIIDLFPAEYQQQIRVQLASTLRAVYNHRLIPSNTGDRVLAVEVMKQCSQISNLIRKGEIHQIPNYLNSTYGSRSMEESLEKLLAHGYIDKQTFEETRREAQAN